MPTALSMILRHRIQRLLMAIVRNKPARRLRQERRTHQYNTAEHHLQPHRDAPRLRGLNAAGRIRHETAGYAADIPERVEHACTYAAVHGMCHL